MGWQECEYLGRVKGTKVMGWDGMGWDGMEWNAMRSDGEGVGRDGKRTRKGRSEWKELGERRTKRAREVVKK